MQKSCCEYVTSHMDVCSASRDRPGGHWSPTKKASGKFWKKYGRKLQRRQAWKAQTKMVQDFYEEAAGLDQYILDHFWFEVEDHAVPRAWEYDGYCYRVGYDPEQEDAELRAGDDYWYDYDWDYEDWHFDNSDYPQFETEYNRGFAAGYAEAMRDVQYLLND